MPGRQTSVLAVAAGALVAALAAFDAPWLLAAFAAAAAVLAAGRLATRGASRRDPPVAAPPLPETLSRSLVDKLPTPVLVIARNGRITHANPAAHQALTRIKPGIHFASVIRAPAFAAALADTLADGGERQAEFADHGARERFFETRLALLPADAGFGAEAQAIALLEDRTPARRAEQLRSDFIANASHELRTPLAAVIGFIETLQNHARDDRDARERFLSIMAREAGRMRRLVDDLMSLSRIEMTEHLRPAESVSLNAIAADSALALSPLAKKQGVRLEVDLPPDGAQVLGDRDQLSQVFSNLLDNALKYGGPGSRVRVRAADPSRANPNRIGISVEDDGPGIAREHIHRLTERFYRVDVAQSRGHGGTGLGLAIVKHVLNRHEGRLEIASTPGEGARFTVWLPRHPRPGDASAAPEAGTRR